ncbi:MAG TPA: hypothetical protein VHI13_16590 [Candidatus Kapabacteria bacterium]|nr:hypothetical protein [Candidatus Kapabacteria bacterium]
MMKTYGAHALVVAGLLLAGVTASMAQTGVASRIRRIPDDQISKQPVAASTVILASSMNLTSAQRQSIEAMDREVASLQAERTRLWAEYRATMARPDISATIATHEAVPRIRQIAEINSRLAPIVDRQNEQLASILSASQRAEVDRMVSTAKAAL